MEIAGGEDDMVFGREAVKRCAVCMCVARRRPFICAVILFETKLMRGGYSVRVFIAQDVLFFIKGLY